MKKIVLFAFVISSLIVASCSSDDDSNPVETSEYPQTVNIKYEVTTSRNSEAIITTTIDNDTQTETINNLPFDTSKIQVEVNNGTYLKLTYLEDGSYIATSDGQTSWTDYEAVLNIYVNNEKVKTATFNITENNSGVKTIDYTFQ